MQETIILVVTHRGLTFETSECIGKLKCPSAAIVRGCPDQSKARSMGIDNALRATEGTPIDTVLMIDDDMMFEPDAIQQIVRSSRIHKECCSAVAVGEAGQVCARPIEPKQLVLVPAAPPRWLTGLACMAVPRSRLVALKPTLPEVGGITEWCRSGAHPDFPGEWLGNDFWFCHHFGGVLLRDVAVGHLKMVPLWPDKRTVREVVTYRGGRN
jgi:hypothetical protein